MRILLAPLAVHTHVLGMVPFAWACRAAGHDVRLASQPRVIDTITRSGLPAVTVGASGDFQTEAVSFLRKRPDQLRHADGNGAPGAGPTEPWIRTAQVCAPDLVALGRHWQPDLVVGDPMVYAAPLVAEVLGVPFVRLLWGPDWPKTGLGMGGYHQDAMQPVRWPPPLLELYESYGARTEIDFAAYTVDPFPPSLQLPGLANRVTMRPTPYNGTGVLPRWLARSPERPRVCLTWGTNTTVYLGDEGFLVPRIMEGLAGLDVEVVLAISGADRERLGDLPTGAHVVEGLPLDLVLPTCSAFISQGGAGAIVTAATHGVAQVVVPLIADQPTNARLLADTGAGLRLDAAAMDAADVRAAAATVIFDEGPRSAAQRLRTEIEALPASSHVVAELTEFVRTGTPLATEASAGRLSSSAGTRRCGPFGRRAAALRTAEDAAAGTRRPR